MNSTDKFIDSIQALKISHKISEDCWYTCPAVNRDPNALSQCCRDYCGTECDCGADEHNAKVDQLLEQLGAVTSEDETETDRFLTDLGRVYQEELARKIAEKCEKKIEHDEGKIGLESIDYRSLVYSIVISVLSEQREGQQTPSEEREGELCGHVGYPFGEPPSMFCDLHRGHPGDHKSAGYEHSAVVYNRQLAGLDK